MIELKNYTDTELEALAGEFLAKHGVRDGDRLLIETVIERFGYRIKIRQGISEYSEAYIPVDGKIVWVDEQSYQEDGRRLRFTFAHELAHALIHVPQFASVPPEERRACVESLTKDQYDAMEREAMQLGAALLMPCGRYRELFNAANGRAVAFGQNGLARLRFIFRDLNWAFDVSRYALALRALKLGLISQGELDLVLGDE
jgi:Zn-dependent peptidase ImmA (M78 family)